MGVATRTAAILFLGDRACNPKARIDLPCFPSLFQVATEVGGVSITSLFSSSGFFSVNKRLVKKLGSLEAAGFFACLCSKSDYWEDRGRLRNGFFYCTQDYIQEELCLSKKKQLKHCRRLESLGLITTKTMGLPKRKFYRINTRVALAFIESSQCVQNGDTVVYKTANKQYQSNKTEIKKHTTSMHGTDDSLFFADQLDPDKYPMSRDAFEIFREMKKEGAWNLYDGPLPVRDWDRVEELLNTAMDGASMDLDYMFREAYNERYRTGGYLTPNSINLCYFLHGYDDTNDGNRLLHMSGEY